MGTNYISSKKQNPNKISISFVVQLFHLSQLIPYSYIVRLFQPSQPVPFFFLFFWETQQHRLDPTSRWHPQVKLNGKGGQEFQLQTNWFEPKIFFRSTGPKQSGSTTKHHPGVKYLHFHPLFKFQINLGPVTQRILVGAQSNVGV